MPDLPAPIREALQPGERPLWHGQPTVRDWWAGAVRTSLTAAAVLALAWNLRDYLPLSPDSVRNILVAIAAVGAFILAFDAWRCRTAPIPVWYLVTDRRAVVLPGADAFGRDRQRSFLPKDLLHARVFTGWLGVGDIVFSSEGKWSRRRNRTSARTVEHLGFLRLANSDVRAAAAAIQTLLERSFDDPQRMRSPGARGGAIAASRAPAAPWWSLPRTREVRQPDDDLLEIRPTLGSRLMALVPLGLLVVVLALMNAAATSGPAQQWLRKASPEVSQGLRWAGYSLAALLTAAALAGAALQACERPAIFNRKTRRYRPAGMLPAPRDLAEGAAIQMLDVRKGIGSGAGQRTWFEINLVTHDARRIHLCAITHEVESRSPGAPRSRPTQADEDLAREIALRLGKFLNLPLLD